jgi:hypothetical protein
MIDFWKHKNLSFRRQISYFIVTTIKNPNRNMLEYDQLLIKTFKSQTLKKKQNKTKQNYGQFDIIKTYTTF